MTKSNYMILAVNPGSTSTKIAVYKNETEQFRETVEHSNQELSRYKSVTDQYEMRKEAVLSYLKKMGFDVKRLSAVVGRGGLLPPVKSGAYRVNKAMLDRLINRPVAEHASNLGAVIAYHIASPLEIPAYIYDSVAVDELEDVARLSGLPEIDRKSLSHALNMRAVAIKTAEKLNKSYHDMNIIVAHLGGGISISVHKGGQMIDIVSDDEGPFSPERAGRVPCMLLAKLCYSGKYDHRTMMKRLRGNGGLVAYLGTNKAVEVEDRIKNGDKEAELVYYAMAYQVAKGIGELATVVMGDVDRIIITGGIAYSRIMTEWIKERVKFIAPVEIMPGENELEALALGALRVLRGEEQYHEYDME